ncbi:MAG TPA: RNA methyltransferase [Alphaproteobacteria bacterium]|nr:RNA methyltransferase [Alphaproteobacteria bacterium]
MPTSLGGPAVILVEPQLGENIGFAARAMLNGGLEDLRLVSPRDGWPNPKAKAAASGADSLVERARVYGRVEDALAGLQRVYASTARLREMVKPVLTPRAAAAEMRRAAEAGERIGILFGPERMGLTNDQVSLADAIIHVPLNPAFASLNLGQAVLLVAYEWWQAGSDFPAAHTPLGKSPRAQRAELDALFAHLERELVQCGFLRNEEKRPSMMRNLRNMLERAALTAQEVRTLRGAIANLVEPKPERAGRKNPERAGTETPKSAPKRRKSAKKRAARGRRKV